jgi:hypothetical protein
VFSVPYGILFLYTLSLKNIKIGVLNRCIILTAKSKPKTPKMAIFLYQFVIITAKSLNNLE